MTVSRHKPGAVVVALRQGKVAIFPTESSYAIGCRYDSRSGIHEIMRCKGRNDARFTVIAASLKQVQACFKLTQAQLQFVQRYWPGAVSLIVTPRFAVRVPASASLRRLAQQAKAPLIASSLNKTGEPAIFDLKHLPVVFQDLPQKNIGRLGKTKPSTVVAIKHGKVVIVRPGRVKV